MPELDDDPIVKNSNEARGGVTGHGVRYMLLVGVCVIIIAFIGVYVWNFW
ncbi:MAG TPA: hypothetical protein VFT69_06145 [Pseudolabrys sp.]|nr:hypothetical protein [Pseudolabrys sp.]